MEGLVMIKRILSILLALVVLIGYLPVTFAVEAETVQSFSDMPDNWATPALKSAIENGLLYGYDGKIMPDSPLTRAQMAAVITRAFGAVEEGDISSYSDVKETDWFASSIAKAYKMGIMQGYAGKMDPNSNITREQVFVILARALKLKPSDTINKTFLDINEISDWAKGEVYAMVNAGYVKGSNGKLNPKANITRAEFAQVMYNIIKQYIRAAGEYTEVTDGNIMVNVPGVTLKNVKINGDLIVGDGVDDGDLVLDNVTVKGRLIVRGGGVNSIIIIGGSVEGEVIIAKVDGNIRVSVEDDADVEVIVIDDGKDNVIVEGTVGTVVVNIPDVPVVIQNATVNNIEVNCEGAADITVAEDAEVEYVVIGDKAKGSSLNVKGSITNVETSAPETKISGTGKVVTVDVNKGADNTSVTTPDSEINNKGASGVTAGGGKEVPENESVTNNSDGSDIVTSPTVTPTPVTPPSSDDSPSYYPVSDISVDSEIMVLKVRETGTIAVTVKPSYATNKRVNWSSDNEDVATVANGVVTAKNPGIATITVTSAADSSKKAMVRLIIGDLVVPANGSIQEAINEATEGQVIAVTPGTYEEQLIIDKPLTLLGPNAMIAGGDKRYPEAIIKGTENGLSQLLELDAENVEINGFTFDDTRIDNYNNTTGTNTNLIGGIAIVNNRFINTSGTAIYLRDGRNAPGEYSKDIQICNNKIETIISAGTVDYNAGSGIIVMGAEDLRICGNIISNAAYNGIQLARNKNATVTDNIVIDSEQPALQIAQWNEGVHEISGNTFSTKSEEKGAIRLYGFTNNYIPEFNISNNKIENSHYGIQIGHGDAGKSYNDIRDANYSLIGNIFDDISEHELIIYLNTEPSNEEAEEMNTLFKEVYGEEYSSRAKTNEDPFTYVVNILKVGEGKEFTTIQEAINAAEERDTILIAAGTYEVQQIKISKSLTLIGLGDQSIIQATTKNAVLTLGANDIIIKDLKLVGAEGTEKGAGIKIGSQVAIDGLTIDNCIIEGFTNGIYADTNSDVKPIVKNVYIANTHFINNTLKGIYVEKLSESTIENCYFEGNGHFHNFAGAGIDINAKYADYNDITIRGCTFVNNGIGTQHGGGILVKARGTGDDTSYSSNPATLVNVKIEDCTFENNPKAIVLGEAEKNNTGPTNVVITNATYIGDGEKVVDYRKKVIPPQDITIVSANDSGIVDSEAYKGVVATFVLGGADLGKVQSVKVELFDDDDNLLAVTTLKSHKFPLSAGNLTAPIVAIEGSYEYGSWNKTEWTEGNPSPHNPPSYVVMTLTDDNGLKYRAEERNLHTVYSGGKTWSKLWPAGDTSITGISVAGVAATVDTEDKTVYYVELPFGTELSELKAEDIVVTTADPNATVADAITEDGGATWKVVVTAEDGITKEIYTIKVTVKKPNWGELADTSWYNDSQTFFTINTAEQLAGLAKLVNDEYNFSGKTIKLGEDIDLADLPWIPIGTGNSAFKGNFDGNNKKISNLYINSNAYINRGISHNGLFGNSQAGKIENVTLENVKIIINTPDDTNYSYTGSLAGLAQFVDNVTVTGSINIEVTGGARYIGGIVGHLYNGAMTNCKLNSTDGYGLISGKYDVGGLAGYVYYGTSITDSTVQNMKINGYLGVGGVSGRIQSENKNAEFLLKDINIENIILGKLYEGTESACVGGILGYPYLGITITIKDSHLEDVKIESSHAYNGLFYGLYSNTEQHGKVILENVSYSGGEFNYLRNIVGLQKGEIAKYYSSIQAAIDEATAGDNIIKVYPGDHGTSPIVIDQKEGVNITLEAVGEVVLKNQILFYGSTRHAGEETLTIRGFTFDFSDATADTEIISAPDRLPNGSYSYAHNISIENNTFRGSLDADVVAIKTTRVFGLEIRNCEGINLHSLGQIRAQSKYLKVSDCTITNAEGGINYYGPIDAEITGLTVYGADTEYGIRAGQSSGTVSGSVLTVSDSDIEAKYPVWLRGDAPETVIITGTKLNVNAEYGQKVKNDAGSTVTIDGAYYVTTEAELRDALSKDANRIVLGDDITLTKHVNLDKHDSLELDGDGHTITVEYDATNR